MASKLSAAKIASWSGVDAVIAAAHRPDVLVDAVEGVAGVGTVVRARSERLSARKLWIAFALASEGTITVDDRDYPRFDSCAEAAEWIDKHLAKDKPEPKSA